MKTKLNHKALQAAVIAVAWLVAPSLLQAADPAATPTTSTNAPTASVVIKNKLTGAELYSIHCNRCHAERYPTERTAAQWKTIMLHMQIRANLPPSQAHLILQYLQDNSGR